MSYFYVVILEGHEEGEESLWRDPESLQQVPLLEYPEDHYHQDFVEYMLIGNDGKNLKVVQVRTLFSRMIEFAVKTSRPQVLMFNKILSSSSWTRKG